MARTNIEALRSLDQHRFHTYTPNNIANLLPFDSYLQDTLNLLHYGIWKQRNQNGMLNTQLESAKYIADARKNPLRPIDDIEDAANLQEWWAIQGTERHPFLTSVSNSRDGVIGVLDGREYTNGITGELSIYVNWIVVRDSGTTEDDPYSYQGIGKVYPVAKLLYLQTEDMARKSGVEVMMAGVNSRNRPSQKFHRNMGFHLAKFNPIIGGYDADGNPGGHKTSLGIYVPPYLSYDIDQYGREIISTIDIFSKRLSRR